MGPSIDPYLGRVWGEGGKETEKETLEPAAWRRRRGSLATGPRGLRLEVCRFSMQLERLCWNPSCKESQKSKKPPSHSASGLRGWLLNQRDLDSNCGMM